MADPQRILVIQLKRAGDVIVTTPVLAALRQRFPAAKLGFLVERPFASLLDHNPNVDEVIGYDKSDLPGTWRRLRTGRWEWVIDFQSSPRSVMAARISGAAMTAGYRVPFWGLFFHRTVKRPDGQLSVTNGKFTLVEALIGPVTTKASRRVFLTDAERRWAVDQMPSSRQPVGLVPTHRRDSRRWTREGFAELARRLLKAGHPVWLFWGPGEETYVDALAAAAPGSQKIPKTTFREMAALFERCSLVVTNDNGPMHLAVAVGAPTVTVYGPTEPLAWNPGGPAHSIIRNESLPCLGCNLNVCPFGHECMRQLTADAVWSEVERRLAQTPARTI